MTSNVDGPSNEVDPGRPVDRGSVAALVGGLLVMVAGFVTAVALDQVTLLVLVLAGFAGVAYYCATEGKRERQSAERFDDMSGNHFFDS